MILKVDFEKTFDKIDHQAMLRLTKVRGFGDIWSVVLLNGILGRTIHYIRGVRQGDLLSPLLFALATDFLQSLINKAKDTGLLNSPIPFIVQF